MDRKKRLGQRLKELREKLDLSASEVARKAGVSQPSIWRAENGDLMPSVEALLNIAAVLQASPAELLRISGRGELACVYEDRKRARVLVRKLTESNAAGHVIAREIQCLDDALKQSELSGEARFELAAKKEAALSELLSSLDVDHG